MEYNISNFDQHMHIVRDVHFDVDKYKVDELYVINLKDPAYLSVQGKIIAQLTEAKEHELKFKALTLNYDPETGNSYNTYGIGGLRFTIDDIIDRRIEIERLLTESEADFRTVNMITQYTGLPTTPPSHIIEQLKSDIHAAYKINTPEEAAEIAKYSQMNIVDDILRAAEEEKKNYVVWLTSIYDGSSKPFPILDSEGNFDPEPFKGLTNGSGRVLVKLIKGNSTIQFNVLSKYIKVTSDAIIITRNKNKSSICMTLMRDNFREMFDKIEFEQIL